MTDNHKIYQSVNEATGKVTLEYDRISYVLNGNTVYYINSYKPKKQEKRLSLVQNADGSIQVGWLTVNTDGSVLLSALEVNTSIRGSFTIEYQYK